MQRSTWITAALLLWMSLHGTTIHAQGVSPEERLVQNDPRSILTKEVMAGKAVLISSIADMDSRDVRESPAHVHVITSRQIEASGARDLFDVLALVPGLAFARDMDDAVGLGIHGNWAGEGKCLFMLNGSPLNENDFGTHSIARRISLSNVDRIEVIVGPGTVIYGSYAALGVVNIVTKSADEAAGTQVLFRTGVTTEGITRSIGSVSGAYRLNRDQDVSYLLSNTRGNNSNAMSLLPDSTRLSFKDSTAMQASTFQFNYRWKRLKGFMSYQEESADVSDAPYRILSRDMTFGLEYRVTLSKNAEITSRLSHSDQSPWCYINTSDPQRLASNTANQRTSASLLLSYKPTSWLSTRLGIQGFHQRSSFQVRNAEAVFIHSGTPTLDMNDGAVFAETCIHGNWGNVTAGYRLEHNDLMGDHNAPRLAYTLARGRLHGKLLWSRAFRMPTVMNQNYGPVDGSLTAEDVTTTGLELGAKLGASGMFTVNLHETRIDDPIVNVHDTVASRNYLNRAMTGTQGIDVRFDLEQEKLTVFTAFGMYRVLAGADIPESMLPEGTHQAYQALPNVRAVAGLSWTASSRFTFRARGRWQGAAWSYQYQDVGKRDLVLMEWPSELLLNAGLTIRPNGKDRLAIELGCNDLLDQERVLLSPVNNGLIPLRLNGREFTLALIFKLAQ